jgi:photoactive yellow protein
MSQTAQCAPPDFDEPQLALAVEQLDASVIHALPYGAIRLDRDGRVRFYSDAEARLSGYGPRQPAGLHFFTQVAPCLAEAGFLTRIERAQATGRLDIQLDYVGSFEDADLELRFRIQSASDGGIWIFTQRL